MFQKSLAQSKGMEDRGTQMLMNCLQGIKDSISSLTSRISSLENATNSKIERKECLQILEKKVNTFQMKKFVEDINNKLIEEKKKEDEARVKIKNQQNKKINQLAKKLKKNIDIVKPQQLHLQSNQTMFQMVIDEISSLQEHYFSLESKLDNKHRATISLNNQVCQKIQHLEKQIESNLKICESIQKKGFESTWSVSDKRVRKTQEKTHYGNDSFDSMRMEIYGKNIQNIQRQLTQKINIKDVLPLIQKNINPLSDQIKQVKLYLEESMQSTKKILIHQTEINQQLCLASKLGWWQSFQEKGGKAIWQKQLLNLYPEGLLYNENQPYLIVQQQGVYLIKLCCLDDKASFIFINEEEKSIENQLTLRLDKGTHIMVPSNGSQVLISVHKI